MYCNNGTNQVMSRSSSNSFHTLTTTLLLVVTLIRGPGNLSLIAMACNQILLNNKVSQIVIQNIHFATLHTWNIQY